ncbi:MAG TPA: TspO/MBR family protein [Planctomycetota bacterium]|nr:TspO/MBR family protein [Planctomycetota bacterium]
MQKKVDWRIFAGALIAVYAAAAIGSLFARTNHWYGSAKPSITPPDWVFPMVWGVLYLLIALSIYLMWTRSTREQKLLAGSLFALNLVLNMLWTYFFFTMQQPVLALIDLVLILLSIVALVLILWKVDRRASLLLVPYGLWVAFAGVLNLLVIVGR